MAPRRRARRRDAAGQRPARGDGGAAVRDDGDHRPPREPERDRGQPRRHRRRLRRGRCARPLRLRRDGPPRAGGCSARAGRERALPRRRRARHGRHPRRLHLHRRDARGGRRVGRRPRRWRAHARGRGTGRRRRRRPPRAPRHRGVAARPLRRPRPGPARHDRPQPPQQHEQRRRLRPAGAAPERGRARHRRHRRRHAGGVPAGLRRPPGRRRRRHAGHGVVMARQRLPLLPRGPRRSRPWTYDHADSPWHVAFSPGMRALDVVAHDGEVLVAGGRPTRVDPDEVRANAAEQAARLFARL